MGHWVWENLVLVLYELQATVMELNIVINIGYILEHVKYLYNP